MDTDANKVFKIRLWEWHLSKIDEVKKWNEKLPGHSFQVYHRVWMRILFQNILKKRACTWQNHLVSRNLFIVIKYKSYINEYIPLQQLAETWSPIAGVFWPWNFIQSRHSLVVFCSPLLCCKYFAVLYIIFRFRNVTRWNSTKMKGKYLR